MKTLLIILSLAFMPLCLAQSKWKDAEAQTIPLRQNLAREIFNFLYKHALHDENNPSDWVYEGAYDLHRCAKELYTLKIPLRSIKVPVSEWKRGGYIQFYDPIAFLQHEVLMSRVLIIIKFGQEI